MKYIICPESITRYCNSISPSCSHSEAVMFRISEILLDDRFSCILLEHLLVFIIFM